MPAKMRPVNEARFEARWHLGRLLKKVMRGSGPGRGKKVSQTETSFRKYLRDIGLDKSRANEAERIGAIPTEKILRKAFAEAEDEGVLNTVGGMLLYAKPYWYTEKRKAKHKAIAAEAEQSADEGNFGPFPLIYTDPPWRFETYTPDNTHRMPDDHYPTLTDDEIVNFEVAGKTLSEIAAEPVMSLAKADEHA
jgi:hypothetical protein